jgi:hypothetical protein
LPQIDPGVREVRCSRMVGRNVTSTHLRFPTWHMLVANLTREFAQFSGKPENQSRAGSLGLGFRWGKLPSLLLVLKSGRLVGAVAKGLVRRVPAPAEGDGGASSEAVRLALHIHQLDFPFDAQRAIISNDDLGGRHSSSAPNCLSISHIHTQ